MNALLAYTRRHSIAAICFLLVFALLLTLLLLGIAENHSLQLTVCPLVFSTLPKEFDGFRIAQISDLHSMQIGHENGRLLDALQKADPDIILFTGDMIDHGKILPAVQFAERASRIAPCYYVTGNHEADFIHTLYGEFEAALRNCGVTLLHDCAVRISRGNASLSIAGVDDPQYLRAIGKDHPENEPSPALLQKLYAPGEFNILLSHRPDAMESFANCGYDLVFAGHVHGGQFRLPFLGGLFSPNNRFFPKYHSGVYREGETCMIVSRGIGNSSIPLRLNNPPELLLSILMCK